MDHKVEHFLLWIDKGKKLMENLRRNFCEFRKKVSCKVFLDFSSFNTFLISNNFWWWENNLKIRKSFSRNKVNNFHY